MTQKSVKDWNPVKILIENIKTSQQMICMLHNARFKGSGVHINLAKERRDTLIDSLSFSIVKSRRLLVQLGDGKTS